MPKWTVKISRLLLHSGNSMGTQEEPAGEIYSKDLIDILKSFFNSSFFLKFKPSHLFLSLFLLLEKDCRGWSRFGRLAPVSLVIAQL